MKNKKVLTQRLNIIPSINNLNQSLQSENEEQFNIYNNDEQSNIQEQFSKESSFELQKNQQEGQEQDHQNISKLLDKLGLKVNIKNRKRNEELEMVVNSFVENCIETVDRKVNTEEYEAMYNEIYEQQLKKQENSQSSIYISQMTQLEKIRLMEDSGIILIIKKVRILLKYISMICEIIVQHALFEAFILIVIMLNSFKMATDDPLATQSSMVWAEDIFTGIYVTEMVLKICALGFLFNKGAYLRDLWNIMDFVIVVTSLLPMIITLDFSISALRAIRVLRPLRTITKIKALKMIIRTLFYSFSLVMDSLYILLFVMFVFSIAGMQLFGGKLKYNCMTEETGFLSQRLCGSVSDCLAGQLCAKSLASPNFSLRNFDTFFWSFLNVFISITLEGWSQIMSDIQKTSGYVYFLYSVMIIFICEYVLLNMTMAILKYKYGQVKENALGDQQEQKQEYEPQFLKKIGIYKDISILSKPIPLTRIHHSSKLQVGSELTLPFQKQEELSNQQLFSYIQAPKALNELVTDKNNINIEELKKYGKVSEYKWDAATLKFETNIESDRDGLLQKIDEKSQSNKSEGQIKNDDYISEQSSQQLYSSSEEDESVQNANEIEIVDKAHQLQQKLKSTHAHINYHNQLNSAFPPSKKILEDFPQQNNGLTGNHKKVTKELSQLDYLLSLIGSKPGTIDRPLNIHIPQIQFDNSMPNAIYEKFADLGDYKIKRIEKSNELKEINVPMKKNKPKESKNKVISAQQAVQENTLDLIELHLKNDLQRKQLRCRLKQDHIIDQERTYDITRVIISQKMKQVQKKKEQIQYNINSLNFNVKYKLYPEKALNQDSIFTRNIQKEKILLKLPQKSIEFQSKIQKTARLENDLSKSKTQIEYLKLLQKNQIQQKIQLNYDQIMLKYFKKVNEKQSKEIKKSIDYEQEYQNIREDDILKKHGYIELDLPIQVYQADQLIHHMNMKKEEYEVHIRGILGWAIVCRKKLTIFASYSAYDNFMLLIVFLNTILMSMAGFVNTDLQPYVSINLAFTYIFTIDLAVKIIAYGTSFFKDMMNLFDTAVVAVSMLEIFMGSGTNLSALRSIRILRAFRVLRITRLIRSLSYMKIVMGVITSIINEFIYVFLLLFLFIFIYTLLGMQLFGGALYSSAVTGVRQNFDTFFSAFFTIFQIMTIQNWNEIVRALASSPVGPWSIIFVISFVFLGNWILLSLLQAILLDGFDDDATNPDKQLQEQKQFNESQQGEQQEEALIDEQVQKSQLQLQKSNASSQYLKTQSFDDASLYLFQPDHCFRQICSAIISSRIFQAFVFISIISSSLKLALDTYINPNQESTIKTFSEIADFVFNFIFIFEAICKIVSYGFIIGPQTYLKSSWNKLDFFIVCMSIFDMLLSSINLSIIKLLRTLRPLRILTRNENMRIMVNSLIESLIGIFNVLIICLCVFLMFAILGMNLLQGKLNYCNVTGTQLQVDSYGPYGIGKAACQAQGGVWALQLINFQNIVSSMLSLYVFSTRQNWPYYVYTFIDATEQGPVQNSSRISIFIYSVLFIFIGSLFFMDLLIGVMFMNYHEAEAKIRPKILTNKQINWQNLQRIIVSEDPCFKLYLKPENEIRRYFFNIVEKKLFQIGIGLIIIINIIIMAISNDDISPASEQLYDKINTACSYIFIIELTLKLIAFGKHYFLSAWNIFDFFVVSASILDIILDLAGVNNEQNSSLSALPQIARIFRVLRITRLLRMFKRFKGLQKLIQTFIFSLPAIGKGLSLLLLYLFISSILASYLMGGIKSDYTGIFNDILHYRDFHHAIQLLYVNLTGQNWYYYMFFSTSPGYVECNDHSVSCVSSLNYIFWLPFVFIGQKVILQLFVLIVLDEFEANYINENNPLGIFSLYEEDFRDNWINITTKYNSTKIETKRLIDLILILRPPLGLGRQETLKKYQDQLQENDKISPEEVKEKINELDQKLRKNGAKILNKMNIMKNRIYFGYHETFYHFTKLAHYKDFMENASPQQLEMLDNLHKESQKQLQKVLPEGNLYYFEQLQNEKQNNVPLNPISLILFTQMIMKSWYNYSIKSKSRHEKKTDKQEIYDSLNNSCASDVQEAKFQKINNQKMAQRREGLLEEKQMSEQRKCEFKPVPNMYAAYSQGKLTKYKFEIPQDRLKLLRSQSRKSKKLFTLQNNLKSIRNSTLNKPE